MANIRNITPDVQHLAELGLDVQPDQLVAVDDDYFETRAFPESIWRVTAAPKQHKKTARPADAAKPDKEHS